MKKKLFWCLFIVVLAVSLVSFADPIHIEESIANLFKF